LQDQLLKAGCKFSGDLYSIIAKDFFVIDLDDPAIACLFPSFYVEANRIVVEVRGPDLAGDK